MKRQLLSTIMAIVMLITTIPETALTVLAEELASAGNTVSGGDTELILPSNPTTDAVEAVLGAISDGDSGSDGTPEVTRLEWLETLVDTFNMTVEEDNYPDNYFLVLVNKCVGLTSYG